MINMGNNNRQSHATQMYQFKNQHEEVYDQYIDYNECCGFKIQKVVKKTLIWEDHLIEDCEILRYQVKWAEQVLGLVKTTKLPRTSFFKEVDDLKTQKFQGIKEEEILLSPSEIDYFKNNLKKSVLLSFGQVAKGSRVRESSKIQSSMVIPSKKAKKKNEGYIDKFRRTSIIGENSSYHKNNMNGFRQSIMSFVDDTISSLFRSENKDISKQTAFSLQVFVHFTMLLENHLNNPENILCLIKNTFINTMIKKYSVQKTSDEIIEDLTNNIKQFLVILNRAVSNFYNIHSFASQEINNIFISNDQNLLTVVTAILFKNQKFYSFFFQMLKEYHRKKQLKLRKILKKMDEKSPESFQIKHDYCLNSQTLKKYLSKRGSIDNDLENFDIEDLESSDEPPYYKCFLAIKQISKTRTPIAKMKIIMDCSQKITESIEEFYSSNNMEMKNWVLDADQILSVFCYIIANTKIPFLHSHLFILQHFATDHQLISVTGYYYSVLTCAIEQMENSFSENQEQLS